MGHVMSIYFIYWGDERINCKGRWGYKTDGESSLSCLLYTDDLILFGESEENWEDWLSVIFS